MPLMSRFMILILPFLAVCAPAALSACKANDPRQVCVRSHLVQGSRGPYYSCDEYAIACLKPLKLDEKDGALFCRLRQPEESE